MDPQLTIALAGNPNSGKTTAFNALTGSHQHVGNYPGITVEKKEGFIKMPSGRCVRFIDLPGTYSLTAYTQEETVARHVLARSSLGITCWAASRTASSTLWTPPTSSATST